MAIVTHNSSTEFQHWKAEEIKIINGRTVRFRDVLVCEIKIADIEDPVMFIAEPLYQWQNSDAGKYVMEHAVEKPYWTQYADYNTFGHVYRVMARLSEQHETFWWLKWGAVQK